MRNPDDMDKYLEAIRNYVELPPMTDAEALGVFRNETPFLKVPVKQKVIKCPS